MGLKELNLKESYDSDSDDLLNDFYISVLSNSISYKRITGFFSSSSLAVAAKGISQFIINGGTMQLVCSAKLGKEDVDAIKNASKDPKEIIEKTILEDLNEIENEFIKDHVSALGWMIANNKLKIKIAIVIDDNGLPTSHGILHPKIGIFEDDKGHKICFSGSNNETASGWLSNIEEFKVFPSWNELLKGYFDPGIKKFEEYWTDNANRVEIIEVPEAVERKLIEIAPKDFMKLDLDKWNPKTKKKNRVDLRKYQKNAIKNWVLNDNKGIFEMATGTGKTYTALGCFKHLYTENENLITIIASPYSHLVVQWEESIKSFGIDIDIIIADSTSPNWKDKLANYLFDIKNGIRQNLVILTTHDTVSNNDFINIMTNCQISELFLIVDEVHAIGSGKRKNGLIPCYKYRLGLSATPTRWFDQEGTEVILKYFGDPVFSFTLEEAIKENYLTPYEYMPKFINLTRSELFDYKLLSEKIGRMFHASDNDKENEQLSLMQIRRQKIIDNALNKFDILNEILDSYENLEFCLIYCADKNQMEPTQDILNDRGIIQHKFTMAEGSKKEDILGGISERALWLEKFANKKWKVLVSIKCLDEGVDVPPARIAILMSSTSNPRQYVQRRGRVLRRFKGKKKAVIYDILVIPHPTIMDPEIKQLEKKIMEKEFKRYKEFALASQNKVECMKILEKYEKMYLW